MIKRFLKLCVIFGFSALLGVFPAESYARGKASTRIDVSIARQQFSFYENDRLVRSGPVSTGRRKHPTPRGTFLITGKERYKKSTIYPEPNGGSPMPYSLHVGTGNIFIHQGHLPGYPASHGCIRVSRDNAKFLFRSVPIGALVSIY